jgi:hypothetical protein
MSGSPTKIDESMTPKVQLHWYTLRFGFLGKFFLILVCLIAGLFLFGSLIDHLPNQGPLDSTRSDITLAEFQVISPGMTYPQVRALLGREGELLSRSDIAGYTTVMYAWKNSHGNMNAMFQDGRLVSKAQFGLR